VVDLVSEFESFNCKVDIYDPWVDKQEAKREYSIMPIDNPIKGRYDAVVLAVAHDEFKKMSIEDIRALGKDNNVIYDIKYLLKSNQVDGRL
jgi:UDP-N-acetyl-D-galactosamine dehydrogenase